MLETLKQSWLWLALGVGLLILLGLLGPVLTPFVIAAILAYALNPGVDWISSKRVGKFTIPREVGVIVMMLLLLAALLALGLIVLPILQKEIPLLQEKIPQFLMRLNAFLGPKLQKLGIEAQFDTASIQQLLTRYFSRSGKEAFAAIFASAKVGGLAVLGWLVTISLVPIALFYLLLDWHPFLKRLENLIPRRWAGKTIALTKEVDALLAQYLRGQLAVMLALAVYYSASLALAGFDVALPIGILTGLLVFIPYIGYGLGLILAIMAAILQFDNAHGLIAVASIYGIGQIMEGFFLTPRLVGERIGLHALTVIFALLAFGQLFGFVGVLLALPASAVISVAVKHLRAHYLSSQFYTRHN
ncbi:MAG: AI-2E family transporter [Burkholderiales bacterium]|nr:AI-2E family transporter [Burkholderiales bacterium]